MTGGSGSRADPIFPTSGNLCKLTDRSEQADPYPSGYPLYSSVMSAIRRTVHACVQCRERLVRGLEGSLRLGRQSVAVSLMSRAALPAQAGTSSVLSRMKPRIQDSTPIFGSGRGKNLMDVREPAGIKHLICSLSAYLTADDN